VVLDLLEPYLRRNLTNRGVERPTRKHVLEEFGRVWPDLTATLGVQEPYAGTIRFKWLVRLPSADAEPFLDDPEGWIAARYGGGKFKLNLHHGMHFVNTKNFKPRASRAGPKFPRWIWTRDRGRSADFWTTRGWGPAVRGEPLMEAEMPSEETRRVLKLFGVAVTNLEDAIDRKAPVAEIMKWDAEVADRTREILSLVDRLRSRRIG